MLIPLDRLLQRYDLNLTGVLHVGAHAGEENAAYRAAGVPQSSIYWVEAIPELASALATRLPNVHQAVVSDRVETVTFRITNNGQSSSMLALKEHRKEHPEIHVVREIPLQTSLLDDLVETHGVRANFLNMDIQGAELKCLQGFERNLSSIDYVYVEVNIKELYEGCPRLGELDAWLDAHGFERKEIEMTPHGWGDAFYMRKQTDHPSPHLFKTRSALKESTQSYVPDKMRTFVQIGTNNGNDRFRALVQTEKPDMTILIEPNTIHNDSIRQSYKGVPNVILINKCIYEKDDEEVTLFIPAVNGVYGNSGENGIHYDDGNYSLVPMNDWGEKSNMHTIKAPSIRFDTLCKRLNISTIDYLQIDTEGYDSEIIKMIDLDAIRIRKLRYEQWNFDETAFTRYNSHHDSLGKKGMKYIEDKLTAHGYRLFPINEPNNADILAVKQ